MRYDRSFGEKRSYISRFAYFIEHLIWFKGFVHEIKRNFFCITTYPQNFFHGSITLVNRLFFFTLQRFCRAPSVPEWHSKHNLKSTIILLRLSIRKFTIFRAILSCTLKFQVWISNSCYSFSNYFMLFVLRWTSTKKPETINYFSLPLPLVSQFCKRILRVTIYCVSKR